MKKIALTSMFCAALACGLWVTHHAPAAPQVEVAPAEAIGPSTPNEASIGIIIPGDLWCEFKCVGQTTGNILACAEGSLEDCCDFVERYCNKNGGYHSGECEDRSDNTTLTC